MVLHLGTAKRDGLIQQTEGIPHASFTRSGNRAHALFADRDVHIVHDGLETSHDLLSRNTSKVEMLTARRNGRGNLVDLGRRKHKHRVRGRLFQRFQQRVKRRIREHVDFIDDVNAIGAAERRKFDVFTKFPDVIDPGIRGSIDFNDVHRVPASNFLAAFALFTRFRSRTVFAIQGLGQNAGDRGLADAAHTGKQISMGDVFAKDGVPQRLDDVRLSD